MNLDKILNGNSLGYKGSFDTSCESDSDTLFFGDFITNKFKKDNDYPDFKYLLSELNTICQKHCCIQIEFINGKLLYFVKHWLTDNTESIFRGESMQETIKFLETMIEMWRGKNG